jgi:chemotaxis protein MotB
MISSVFRVRRSIAGRTWPLMLALGLTAPAISGCGYSEDEWQKKLREIQDLQAQLTTERDQHEKTRKDLDAIKAELDTAKAALKDKGIEISNLNASLDETSRALEAYRKRAEQLEAIKRRFENLKNKLAKLTDLGLKVTVRKNRMVVQLPGDVLFDSGAETLKKEGKEILARVAEVIRNDSDLAKRTYQVAGHTDSDQMKGKYKDNWGLSVMRAREVLAFLVDPVATDGKGGGGGLSPERWSAAGYGETDPVKPNDTKENKQSNRRCELVVLPNVEEMLDLGSLN